jgi:hypothetical protein
VVGVIREKDGSSSNQQARALILEVVVVLMLDGMRSEDGGATRENIAL